MRVLLGDLRRTLHEALKKSDAENVASSLERAAGRVNSRVTASVDLSGQMFNVFVRHLSGDVEQVEALLIDEAEKNGWSLLSRSDRNGRLVWWFEPKPEIKGPLSKKVLPPELYHVTPRDNVEGIMANGLQPKQRTTPGTTRRYTGRVYLATSPAGATATSKSGEDWAMLKVDTSKLKGMKFYVDQEFGHRKDGVPVAVYTLDQIPPEVIDLVS